MEYACCLRLFAGDSIQPKLPRISSLALVSRAYDYYQRVIINGNWKSSTFPSVSPREARKRVFCVYSSVSRSSAIAAASGQFPRTSCAILPESVNFPNHCQYEIFRTHRVTHLLGTSPCATIKSFENWHSDKNYLSSPVTNIRNESSSLASKIVSGRLWILSRRRRRSGVTSCDTQRKWKLFIPGESHR
jgi:hypothetical protein